jgi:hypothetical protein
VCAREQPVQEGGEGSETEQGADPEHDQDAEVAVGCCRDDRRIQPHDQEHERARHPRQDPRADRDRAACHDEQQVRFLDRAGREAEADEADGGRAEHHQDVPGPSLPQTPARHDGGTEDQPEEHRRHLHRAGLEQHAQRAHHREQHPEHPDAEDGDEHPVDQP